MKKWAVLLIALAFVSSTQAGPKKSLPKETSTKRLLILGNNNQETLSQNIAVPDQASQWFVNTVPAGKPIVIIGWNANYLSNNAGKVAFSAIGPFIESQEVIMVTEPPANEAQQQELIENIKKAGGIFLTGNSPEALMNVFSAEPVKQALKGAYESGVTIAGINGGSQIMGTTVIIDQNKDEREKRVLRSIKGLGLLKAEGLPETIVQDKFNYRTVQARKDFYHMQWGYAPPELLQGMKEHNAMGVALDAGAALIVREGNQMSVMTDLRDTRYKVRVFTDYDRSRLTMVDAGSGYLYGEPEIRLTNLETFDLNKAIPASRLCKNVF